jgi:hypothetical protein
MHELQTQGLWLVVCKDYTGFHEKAAKHKTLSLWEECTNYIDWGTNYRLMPVLHHLHEGMCGMNYGIQILIPNLHKALGWFFSSKDSLITVITV